MQPFDKNIEMTSGGTTDLPDTSQTHASPMATITTPSVPTSFSSRYRLRADDLTPMQRKFRALGPDPSNVLDVEWPADWNQFRPTYFFFYGSLMDPARLREVLRLSQNPELVTASIVGWRLRLWGQYPAVTFKGGYTVHGMAYMVETEEQVAMLQRYETDVYKLRVIRIRFSDGSNVQGKMFVWNADESLLREGQFDLKDWQMSQVG